jgi:hypothetical protein
MTCGSYNKVRDVVLEVTKNPKIYEKIDETLVITPPNGPVT